MIRLRRFVQCFQPGLRRRLPTSAKRARSMVNAVLTGCVLILLAPPAGAVEIGTVARLAGRADARNDNRELRTLHADQDSVYDKDVVRTKSDSTLDLTMKDGSRISLAANSRLELAEYETEGETHALLKLTRGRMQLFVTRMFSAQHPLIVETPQARIPASGAELEIDVGFKTTTLFVIDGDLRVTSNQGEYDALTLYAGEGAVVRPDAGPVPVNHLSGQEGAEAQRIYSDIGSGGQLDLIAAGIQTGDPSNTMPTVPSALPLPTQPNTP